jgi:hypothetical protein
LHKNSSQGKKEIVVIELTYLWAMFPAITGPRNSPRKYPVLGRLVSVNLDRSKQIKALTSRHQSKILSHGGKAYQ